MCNALSIHLVSFLVDACPLRCSKAAIYPTTLAEAVFLSSPVAVLGFMGRNENKTPITVHPAAFLVL